MYKIINDLDNDTIELDAVCDICNNKYKNLAFNKNEISNIEDNKLSKVIDTVMNVYHCGNKSICICDNCFTKITQGEEL